MERSRPPAIQLPTRSSVYVSARAVGRVTRGSETGKPDAQDLFGRQRRESLWIKPPGVHTPTCATERAAACAHTVSKAHGIKSWGLWNVLNVIHGSVSGRRYVNQPRWVQSDPRTARDDSCVPGIPNFVDYNYKSATLMLMSLSSILGCGVDAFGWLGSAVEERRVRESDPRNREGEPACTHKPTSN
ncbi:hypothetical protein K0M31_018213 [Melipona bicolor]|uniref:Uncharacterized protein n=1 Tax=Melipona bicolor TaxID=60889 RepID=A0AA40FD60_9HYME|nr:hypothetical protein K0M31_018213 [Melipona bicolor]